MQNFVFHNPVRILFGRDALAKLPAEFSGRGGTALVVYGQGHVIRSGLLERVTSLLQDAGIRPVLFGGVVSNPLLSHVREGITLGRSEAVDYCVAVGGGSVLDSTKAIAAGIPHEGDVWEFFDRRAKVQRALPIYSVLTLAATGSEMNGGTVITNDTTREKFSAGSPLLYPRVSVLDPTLTFSVNPAYTAYGAVDAAAHLMEPYFNNTNPNDIIQRELTEGLIRGVRDASLVAVHTPDDYDARATLMWGATLALNGITSAGMGRTMFPVHAIEHSLSALHDIPHGAGLSIVYPGWLRSVFDEKTDRIARFGRSVFNVVDAENTAAAAASIDALVGWYRTIGSPASLKEWGLAAEHIAPLADNAVRLTRLWGMDRYDAAEISRVLHLCLD